MAADWIVPLLLAGTACVGLAQRRNVFSLMTEGAQEGLRTLLGVVPHLIVLLSAIRMLRASGALDACADFLSPAFAFFGIPAEVAPLMLIRPFSGSAALAVGAELITAHGADSLVGRVAAVMLGSTETTFYAISVYFGAAGVKDARYTIPAALLADLTGFFLSALTVRLFFSASL